MPDRIDMNTFKTLQETVGADFIDELIDTFLDEATSMFRDLRQSLETGNAEVFRRAAHSLKSNANTFGALRLGEMARELEGLGRANQLDAVGEKLTSLEAEYAQAADELKALRNGGETG